jgi:vesicle transport through interaction with t-SNAREs protein 1
MRLLESANGNVDTIISYCVDIESEISECEGYLKAMEIETKSMVSIIDKKNSQQKVNDYKDEMKQIYKRYETAKFNAESLALKSNPGSRTKLLTANQRLDESTRTLEQSRMIIGQTENIGNNIITDLESQREILVGAQGKVM